MIIYFLESAKLRTKRALVPYVPCALRARAVRTSFPTCSPASGALRALVPQVLRTLRALVPYVPRASYIRKPLVFGEWRKKPLAWDGLSHYFTLGKRHDVLTKGCTDILNINDVNTLY